MSKKRTITRRDDLGEDTLVVLREFEGWFFPATMEEVGQEFPMFLKWLGDNGYVITKEEYQL